MQDESASAVRSNLIRQNPSVCESGLKRIEQAAKEKEKNQSIDAPMHNTLAAPIKEIDKEAGKEFTKWYQGQSIRVPSAPRSRC